MPAFSAGDAVIATGYELGTGHAGGYAERVRVPADWLVPAPEGLSAEEAMALGTAGLTAAISLEAIEAAGIAPESGPVIVSGATGGVGSTAVAMLAARGYTVAASTGKADAHDFLRELGASEILDRAELGRREPPPAGVRTLGCRRRSGRRQHHRVDPCGRPSTAARWRSPG